MARRIYEEDSFTEGFEEVPLQRTRRIRGGHKEDNRRPRPDARAAPKNPGPSASGVRRSVFAKLHFELPPGPATKFVERVFAAELIDDPSVQEPSVEEPAEDNAHAEIEPNEPDYRASTHSSNTSRVVEKVDFMSHLCNKMHNFESRRLMGDLKSKFFKCKACHEGLFETKERCNLCGVYVHPQCEGRAPLPCIEPTPIPVSRKFHISDCTTKVRCHAKVPAILTKLFHEIQKEERIRRPNLYLPIEQYEDDLAEIKKWTVKLCRSPLRYLGDEETRVLTGCVLRFLLSIRDNIISPDDVEEFFTLQQKLALNVENSSPAERPEMERIMRTELRIQLVGIKTTWDLTARHTFAALVLHLKTVIAQSEHNLMTQDAVLSIFRPVLPMIDFLFLMEEHLWLEVLAHRREPHRD